MTDERLAEIKALCDAAAPAPWKFVDKGNTVQRISINANGHNAAFIAQSRTIVPELIAEVERLQAKKAEMQIDVENVCKRITQLQSENAQLRVENERLREALEEVEYSLANSRFSAAWAAIRKWRGVKAKESADNE